MISSRQYLRTAHYFLRFRFPASLSHYLPASLPSFISASLPPCRSACPPSLPPCHSASPSASQRAGKSPRGPFFTPRDRCGVGTQDLSVAGIRARVAAAPLRPATANVARGISRGAPRAVNSFQTTLTHSPEKFYEYYPVTKQS